MSTEGRESGSWAGATVDTVASVSALAVIWYPALHYANALARSPLTGSTVDFAVTVLAFGSAYPFVAGDFSLGDLGEYLFVLVGAALGWGVVGTIGTVGLDVRFSGANRAPEAVVWGLAYVTTYVVVCRTRISVFR